LGWRQRDYWSLALVSKPQQPGNHYWIDYTSKTGKFAGKARRNPRTDPSSFRGGKIIEDVKKGGFNQF
jgi:hypothetical protein